MGANAQSKRQVRARLAPQQSSEMNEFLKLIKCGQQSRAPDSTTQQRTAVKAASILRWTLPALEEYFNYEARTLVSRHDLAAARSVKAAADAYLNYARREKSALDKFLNSANDVSTVTGAVASGVSKELPKGVGKAVAGALGHLANGISYATSSVSLVKAIYDGDRTAINEALFSFTGIHGMLVRKLIEKIPTLRPLKVRLPRPHPAGWH